ncbi:MAG: proteasome assembly chaperone family protein [Euryarchaeota archaeon]|nr:proteasome assembly chaperone family protein [Euryarchaeota archaeon]
MVDIVTKGKPKLDDPVFIEGLPGVGNVGKLAVEHLNDELTAKPLAEVYCKDFPPQVFIDPDGTVKLVKNDIRYVKKGTKSGRDLILLTGDYQGLTSAGQYDLVTDVLDLLETHGCKELYTLGGYGLGRMVTEPAVLGAAIDKKSVTRMKKHGVEFREDEPGGGIVGASGLFLGLGKVRGMTGACLMGETSGYLVDPTSAQAVLRVLESLLSLKIDYSRLDDKARDMDKIAQQLKEMERKASERSPDDLRYIG